MSRYRVESGSPVAAAYFGLGMLAVGAYFLVPAGNGQNVYYDLIGASAVIAILAGIRLNRPSTAVPWLLFAGGTTLFVAGDIATESAPTGLASNATEALYLAGYPLLAAGLVLLLFRAGGHHRLAAMGEAGIATFAFAIFQWVYLSRPALDQAGSLTTRAVNFSYTAADVVLLAGCAGFFVSAAWRRPAFLLLVGGVAALLVGDEVYALYYGANGYYNGAPVDAAWLVSYVLLGTAALHVSMRELSQPRRSSGLRVGNWRLALLGAAVLTPVAILSTQYARGKPLEAPAITAATIAITILVLWRLIGMLRALESLRLREREARGEVEAARMLLAEQNERLREADQLKDEFISLISHDLRTPLTSVIGYTELALEDGEELGEAGRGHLQVVSRNAERLLRLVDDLLFIARLQAGRGLELSPSEVDLATVALQTVVEAQPRAHDKGLDLRYRGAETAILTGDRGRLFQLLDNLVGNAIKFTPAGGLIEVGVENGGGEVILEVQDTGIGLDPGDAERMFERFFRSSRATSAQIPGTGLGLFIAQAIAEAHSGRISAHARDGGGTTLRVELPVRAPEQRENDSAELVA